MSDSTKATRPFRPRPTRVLAIILLFIVVATTGLRFLNGPVYDDVMVIEKIGVIHQPKRALEAFGKPTMYISLERKNEVADVNTYRPIPVLSFFLNSAISGKKLWSYHLTNLILHGTCVLLLFAFLRRWLGRGQLKAAALGATFFAIHPWLAEAHVWINGRSDPFALMFGLGAALLLMKREKETTAKSLALAGLLFFCGLCSKEVLFATLPAFFFLEPRGGVSTKARLVRMVPLVVATAVYLVLRIRALGGMKTHESGGGFRQAFLQGPYLVFDALYHLIVPSFPFLRMLEADYKTVPRSLFYVSFVVLAVIVVVVFRTRKRLRTGIFAALFFIGSMAPVAGITVVPWAGFGRYLYFPGAALAIVLAELLVLSRKKLETRPPVRRGLAIALAGYLFVQGGLLVSFTTDMDRDETLYLAATERRPNQAYGWGALGGSYLVNGNYELAIGAFTKAYALDPSEPKYSGHLSVALAHEHRCADAVKIAKQGLVRFPHYRDAAPYQFVLGVCAASPEEATFHLRRCLIEWVAFDDCERTLHDLVTKHEAAPVVRATLRRLAEVAPSPAFDRKWSALARDPEAP